MSNPAQSTGLQAGPLMTEAPAGTRRRAAAQNLPFRSKYVVDSFDNESRRGWNGLTKHRKIRPSRWHDDCEFDDCEFDETRRS